MPDGIVLLEMIWITILWDCISKINIYRSLSCQSLSVI
jgi:hypothetical protein